MKKIIGIILIAVVVAGVAWVAWHVVLIAMHISELAKSKKYSFWPYIESEDREKETINNLQQCTKK